MTAIPLDVRSFSMRDGSDDETALVQRAKTDRDAVADLYRKYLPRMTTYVARRVGTTSETEDIVANVFLAMVRGLPRFRCGEAPFAAWLYRIATNEINRSLRKRRIRHLLGFGQSVLDSGSPPEPHERLRVALAELPLPYQTALSLHYLEELSVEEICQVTGAAPGTVKSRLSRGRDLLRRKLQYKGL